MTQLKTVVDPFGEVNVYPAAGGKSRVVATILMQPHKEGAQTGIALDGSVISIDRSANAALYHKGGVTASEIFSGQAPAPPDTAQRFLERLAQSTGTSVRSSPVPQADVPATAGQPSGAAPTAEPARTYPLEEQKK